MAVAVAVATVLLAGIAQAYGSPAEGGVAAAPHALPFAVAPAGSAERKVFAHYFPPYPISLDNKRPSADYYARNYLSPDGENGKYSAVGGLLRDRPLPRAPSSGNWRTKNLTTEVRQAADAGIDGFTVDILSLSGQNWETTTRLMQAATRSGRKFTIVPNLDTTASAGSADPAMIAGKLAQLYKSSSAYRLADGRYVLSSFKAEGKPVAWWSAIVNVLSNRYHIRVAFIAVLLNASDSNMLAFAPVSYALSEWGSRTPQSVEDSPNRAKMAHAMGVKWMSPIAVQDVRPSSSVYAEAGNTETLRASWTRAIADGADMAQLITWNDYSESTSFAPSIAHGSAFLDVNAYYLTEFKRRKAPVLHSDAMVVTHRIQLASTSPLTGSELMTPDLGGTYSVPRDTVEVLTMLTTSGTVTARIGGLSYSARVAAGVHAMTFPLRVGKVSVSVARKGSTIMSAASPFTVTAHPVTQDLQYYAVVGRD